ncbi:MAG: FAD-dependent oxidoreductase, partial [Pseudomonadota bacterium]
MGSFKILVVGDGIIGLAAAWRLAASGHQVTCIGDNAPASSDAAAGMLAPSFERYHPRAARDLGPLLDDGLAKWAGFAEALAAEVGDTFGYQRNGITGIGFAGAPSERAVPCPPPDGFPASRAWHVAGEGQVDPRLLRRALAKALVQRGGVRISSHVDQIELRADNLCVRSHTSVFNADRIIIAGGFQATELLSLNIPMEGVRGRAFLQHVPDLKLDHVVRTPTVYFCPKTEGQVYVGATEEAVKGEKASIEGLWWEAVSICPALQGTKRVSTFDGIRPAPLAGLPQVGHWAEDERVFLAFGHDR